MLLVLVSLIGTLAGEQSKPSLEAQLQAAIHRETVKGDVQGAIEDYKRIADGAHDDPSTAVQALLRLAGCYQRVGDVQASEIYERILRDHPEEKEAVATARARLARISPANSARRSTEPIERVIWTGDGVPLEAAITPDGRYLAYADSNSKGNLVVRDLITGTVRPLTTTADWGADLPQYAGAVSISPGGKQVAYAWLVSRRVDGRVVSSWQLRIRSLSTPAPEDGRLVYEHDANQWFAPTGWTPDARAVLVGLKRPDNTRQIALVSTTDGSVTVLKTLNWRGGHSSISPDGKWVAFDAPASEETSQRDIFVLAVDGSQQGTVLSGPSRESVIGWTPDGRHLLFTSDRRGPLSLWSQSMDGAKPTGDPVLLRADTRGFALDVADRSGAIPLLVMTDNRTIFTAPIRAGGGERSMAQAPVTTPWPSVSQPRWSPDGHSVSFLTNRVPNAAPDSFLSIHSFATGRLQEVPIKLTYIWEYQWTPDGKGFVARATDYQGRNGIFRMEMSGEVRPIELARTGERLVAPRLSADGRHAYYARLGNAPDLRSLVVRDLQIGTNREVPLPYPGRFVSASPNGEYAAGVENAGKVTYVWVVAMRDGRGTRVLELKQPNAVRGVDWLHDSSGLLVTTPRASGPGVDVWRVSSPGGERVKLDVDARHTFGADMVVHPDGSQVAFRGGGPLKFEIRLLENYLPSAQGPASDRRREP
jgi:Tol biopolymer transport system component